MFGGIVVYRRPSSLTETLRKINLEKGEAAAIEYYQSLSPEERETIIADSIRYAVDFPNIEAFLCNVEFMHTPS